jgi:hypothetical protein
VQEVRNVGADLRRDGREVEVFVFVESVQGFQPAQRGGRVRAGAAQARARWDAFVQVEARGQRAPGCLLDRCVGFEDRVARA